MMQPDQRAAHDMALFDALPQNLRDALNHSAFTMDLAEVHDLLQRMPATDIASRFRSACQAFADQPPQGRGYP